MYLIRATARQWAVLFIIVCNNFLSFVDMFWEEKIDQLKKLFAPADFHVPFTDGEQHPEKDRSAVCDQREASLSAGPIGRSN